MGTPNNCGPAGRSPSGPWMLVAHGVWGSGRRSLTRIDDVTIRDFSPDGLDDDTETDDEPGVADSKAWLFEEEEPTPGLLDVLEWLAVGRSTGDE